MYKSPKYTKQMLQIIKTFRAEWSGLRKKAEQQAATIPHPPLPLTFINNVMFTTVKTSMNTGKRK